MLIASSTQSPSQLYKLLLTLLSVIIWILNKIDGVGTSRGILFDLEIFSGEPKRSKNQVPKIFQFTCNVKGKIQINTGSKQKQEDPH